MRRRWLAPSSPWNVRDTALSGCVYQRGFIVSTEMILWGSVMSLVLLRASQSFALCRVACSSTTRWALPLVKGTNSRPLRKQSVIAR